MFAIVVLDAPGVSKHELLDTQKSAESLMKVNNSRLTRSAEKRGDFAMAMLLLKARGTQEPV